MPDVRQDDAQARGSLRRRTVLRLLRLPGMPDHDEHHRGRHRCALQPADGPSLRQVQQPDDPTRRQERSVPRLLEVSEVPQHLERGCFGQSGETGRHRHQVRKVQCADDHQEELRGPWLACSAYPKCRSSKSINAELREQLKDLLPPPAAKKELPKVEITELCPECNSPMKLRQGRGNYFLGCSKYPKCRGTKEVPPDIVEQLAATTT